MWHRLLGHGLAGLAIIAIIGCSSGSPSVAPSGSGSAAPSSPVASQVSAVPLSAAPSVEPSSAAPSIAIPGFSFPSTDKELEALIPDRMCGAKVEKGSMTGAQVFNDASDPTVVAALQSLGKTTADVSAAVGIATDCFVFIIRVKGADESQLKQVFIAQAAKDGKTYSEASVGGKTVLTTDPSKFDYSYIKGDGVVIVAAKNAKDAAEMIAALP